jgi:hypothetical protein
MYDVSALTHGKNAYDFHAERGSESFGLFPRMKSGLLQDLFQEGVFIFEGEGQTLDPVCPRFRSGI